MEQAWCGMNVHKFIWNRLCWNSSHLKFIYIYTCNTQRQADSHAHACMHAHNTHKSPERIDGANVGIANKVCIKYTCKNSSACQIACLYLWRTLLLISLPLICCLFYFFGSENAVHFAFILFQTFVYQKLSLAWKAPRILLRISFILSHICFLLRGVGFCCCLFFTFVFSVACSWSKRHIGVQCLLKENLNNARVSWGRAFIFRGTTGACWGPAFIY